MTTTAPTYATGTPSYRTGYRAGWDCSLARVAGKSPAPEDRDHDRPADVREYEDGFEAGCDAAIAHLRTAARNAATPMIAAALTAAADAIDMDVP